MIKIYKKKPNKKSITYIKINDVFFNKYTVEYLDDRARDVIKIIDKSEMVDKYYFESRFDGGRLNIDKLSTGCKTALNIMYNPDKIFDISECGENALDVIYGLEDGMVYCEYPMIAFNMQKVKVADDNGEYVITDYDKLRKWWKK